MINQIISSINFRGKGRLLNFLRRLIITKEYIHKIKKYPSADAVFGLSHIWSTESNFMFFGFPARERNELIFLKNQKLKEGDIFDIGANIGCFALYFFYEILNSDYKIHAFEPIQELFRRLHKNIELNKALDKIEADPRAVSKISGMTSIYLSKNLFEESGSSSTYSSTSGIKITVPTVNIDDYSEKKSIKKISLIKIDIEGGEADVLLGSLKTLKKWHPAVFFEVNKNNFNGGYQEAYKVFQKIFEPLKYQIFFQDGLTKTPIIDAIREGIIKDGNWYAE